MTSDTTVIAVLGSLYNACNPLQITSADSATVVAGTPFTFTVTTCATAPPIIKGSHLPRGLRLVSNRDGTATISGTPSLHDGGILVATVTASVRNQALATQSFTFTVDNAPVFKPRSTDPRPGVLSSEAIGNATSPPTTR
jgi:hypothetical protein